MSLYRLFLYISGDTARSQKAIMNLRRICEAHLGDACEISIIDILRCPDQAEEARIFATPTVVRMIPDPQRRVVGDLSDEKQVLSGLSLPRQGQLAAVPGGHRATPTVQEI